MQFNVCVGTKVMLGSTVHACMVRLFAMHMVQLFTMLEKTTQHAYKLITRMLNEVLGLKVLGIGEIFTY